MDECACHARQAIFSVSQDPADVLAVIRFEKVLEGDSAKAADNYVRAADEKLKDDKFVEKIKGNARQFCKRLGKYTMPFAWTAVVLEDAAACCSGDLSPSLEIELFQQSTDKLRDEDLWKYLADLLKAPDKRSTTKKLRRIPGLFRFHVRKMLANETPPLCLTPVKNCLQKHIREESRSHNGYITAGPNMGTYFIFYLCTAYVGLIMSCPPVDVFPLSSLLCLARFAAL